MMKFLRINFTQSPHKLTKASIYLYLQVGQRKALTQCGNDIKPLIPTLLSQATCETLCLSAALI